MKKIVQPIIALLLVSALGCSKGGDNNIKPPVSNYTVTTLPGSFISPISVAVDPSGNIYVADVTNKIGRISGGSVNNAYCGTGNYGMVDGPASSASFWSPGGLATDAQGAVYVADQGNNSIRKIAPDGVVTTVAGGGNGGAGYVDGNLANARFAQPSAVAVDASGQIYVADWGNKKIRKISSGMVTTLANDYSFTNPGVIACDANGNVFVGDFYFIRKISPTGQVSTVGKEGEFYYPSGLAVNSAGDIFFVKGMYNSIGKITPAGTVTIIAGPDNPLGGYRDGDGNTALFDFPVGVCLDGHGNIYVADYGNGRIRKVSPK